MNLHRPHARLLGAASRALAVALVSGGAVLGTSDALASPSVVVSASAAQHDAATAARGERYTVELQVIEATPAGKGSKGKPNVDKRLASLAKDLSNLTQFSAFRLVDSSTSTVGEDEKVSLEIPKGKGGKRFLEVTAQGKHKNGKLRFLLGIDALKFETLVAVPDGGRVIVATPRGGEGKTLLFVFAARSKG